MNLVHKSSMIVLLFELENSDLCNSLLSPPKQKTHFLIDLWWQFKGTLQQNSVNSH